MARRIALVQLVLLAMDVSGHAGSALSSPDQWSNVSLTLLLRTCAAHACVHTYERDLRPSLLAFFGPTCP